MKENKDDCNMCQDEYLIWHRAEAIKENRPYKWCQIHPE